MSELEDAVDWLYSLGKFGIKLGLDNTLALMEVSGNPVEDAKGVHIAGTNGKGSVAAMLSSMLEKGGYLTGRYTSPHLVDFRERISVGGENIPEDDLLSLITEFRKKVDALNGEGIYPTFFEVLTSMAFSYFKERGADVWVVETGMGGRLDSTNITRFKTGVITNIGMDHTRHLGDSVEKIALEKAGIIKEGMNLITGASGSALDVIKENAERRNADVFSFGTDFRAELLSMDLNGTELLIDGIYDDYHVKIPLLGRHQAVNASMAVAAAELLRHGDIYLEKSVIISALRDTRWPGRFELVSREPPIILDAAHNLPGAEALSRTLMDLGLWGEYTLVLGMLSDKDADGMASLLVKGASEVIITEPEYTERAMKMEELMKITSKYGEVKGIRNPVEAVSAAMEKGAPVLVTGSIYLLGDVLSGMDFHKKN